MRFFKNIRAQFFIYAVWALIAVMFWSWVFGIITDTDREHKVSLFADVAAIKDTELAVELEKNRPEGIKMVKVHSFEYAMFDDSKITSADLYIIKSSDIATYIVDFQPVNFAISVPETADFYEQDGQRYGIQVHRAGMDDGSASSYLNYSQGEDYYLFFGKDSVHTGQRDTAAVTVAETLLLLK